jgi:hypothetical protein
MARPRASSVPGAAAPPPIRAAPDIYALELPEGRHGVAPSDHATERSEQRLQLERLEHLRADRLELQPPRHRLVPSKSEPGSLPEQLALLLRPLSPYPRSPRPRSPRPRSPARSRSQSPAPADETRGWDSTAAARIQNAIARTRGYVNAYEAFGGRIERREKAARVVSGALGALVGTGGIADAAGGSSVSWVGPLVGVVGITIAVIAAVSSALSDAEKIQSCALARAQFAMVLSEFSQMERMQPADRPHADAYLPARLTMLDQLETTSPSLPDDIAARYLAPGAAGLSEEPDGVSVSSFEV